MPKPPSLDSFARAQRGLVTSRQLDILRIPSSTKCDWVKAGRLHRLHPNVFRVNGAPVSFEQRCLAATLATDCFVDAQAAVQLWGFHTFDDESVDVIVERTRNPRLKGVRVYRSEDLAKFRMTRHLGIPIVPPTLALLDFAATVNNETDAVKEAMEQAFVSKRTTPKGLSLACDLVARRGRPGVALVRALLADRSLGEAASDATSEIRFAELCRRFGLPMPTFHYRVLDSRGVFVAEPDFAYVERRIAIEIDSVSIHGTAGALQHDLERQNRLINAGWTVLRFSWHDVTFRPAYVARTIRQLLGT